jgi:two-component system, response regulator PdtaR
MNILVVEDDANVAMVLEYALTSAGHQVLGPLHASAGAYELALNEKADLALIDVKLTDGDTGPALAETLYQELSIPTVFVTGHEDKADLSRAGSLGYIVKPYNLKQVLETIETIKAFRDGNPPPHASVELNTAYLH